MDTAITREPAKKLQRTMAIPTAIHKINAKIPLNVPILEPQNKDVMARKIWRVIKISLLGFIGLLAFLIVCALSYRAIRQHENSAALAIHTPNGISEAMFAASISGSRSKRQIATIP